MKGERIWPFNQWSPAVSTAVCILVPTDITQTILSKFSAGYLTARQTAVLLKELKLTEEKGATSSKDSALASTKVSGDSVSSKKKPVAATARESGLCLWIT